MAKKNKSSLEGEASSPVSQLTGRQIPRMQTAEGWKRKLLKKSSSRNASKS